jgi:hypothetical protein
VSANRISTTPEFRIHANATAQPASAKVLLCMESSTPSSDTAWAMSEENVEIVRGYIDAVNAFMRGELSSEAHAESL